MIRGQIALFVLPIDDQEQDDLQMLAKHPLAKHDPAEPGASVEGKTLVSGPGASHDVHHTLAKGEVLRPSEVVLRIRIDEVDRKDVVVVGDRTLGYRGRFTSDLVSGEAVLIPYSDREENLFDGAHLSVEVEQEAVTHFEVVDAERDPSMTALATPGDYAVVGTVSNITLTVEGEAMMIDVAVGGTLSFYVDAEGIPCTTLQGGCSFALDPAETGGIVPQVGDRASFKVHGLTLWDANI